jgi:hypothetical protein
VDRPPRVRRLEHHCVWRCQSLATSAIVARRSSSLHGASTLTAAIRTEEAFLSRNFADAYDLYRRSAGEPATRPFSLERARKNREHRAVIGLVGGFGLLALKILLNL